MEPALPAEILAKRSVRGVGRGLPSYPLAPPRPEEKKSAARDPDSYRPHPNLSTLKHGFSGRRLPALRLRPRGSHQRVQHSALNTVPAAGMAVGTRPRGYRMRNGRPSAHRKHLTSTEQPRSLRIATTRPAGDAAIEKIFKRCRRAASRCHDRPRARAEVRETRRIATSR